MRDFKDLSHVIRPLPGGGQVLVLDTGALLDPESQAMLMARYSRSSQGALALLADMFNRDAGKFMRNNYKAGYGHKSIAELGEAAICIDGVSMLAAKAVQDFPLYRGQESSTRYIDFSKQRFVDPSNLENEGAGKEVLEGWRSFYMETMPLIVADLFRRFPRKEDESEKDHDKAIKARAFDIARAFLPAGASTNVAWVGDLRHVNDHLATLRNHPLEEVRTMALAIEDALLEKFPDSFSRERREDIEAYLRQTGHDHAYLQGDEWPDFEVPRDEIDVRRLESFQAALSTRPRGIELPYAIRECGTIEFEFLLDFGSFRDLQRQRAVAIRMPLLSADARFAPWYLEQLPSEIRRGASAFISDQIHALSALADNPFDEQYYLPMGMEVPIRMSGDLRALVYVVELRSTRFVHPTLVKRAVQMAAALDLRFEESGLVLHLDPEPGRFDVRRGRHDIEKIA